METTTKNATASMPARSNRERFPELYAAVDTLRATFGANQVRVALPIADATYAPWSAVTGYVKAPRAKAWRK